MLEALFGADMPLAVRFLLAFLIVLGLIGATAWAVRRFGAGRLGGAGTRGRQPRLAVVDDASVDSRRRRKVRVVLFRHARVGMTKLLGDDAHRNALHGECRTVCVTQHVE
jgi:flagellar biogenesis protein FliO